MLRVILLQDDSGEFLVDISYSSLNKWSLAHYDCDLDKDLLFIQIRGNPDIVVLFTISVDYSTGSNADRIRKILTSKAGQQFASGKTSVSQESILGYVDDGIGQKSSRSPRNKEPAIVAGSIARTPQKSATNVGLPTPLSVGRMATKPKYKYGAVQMEELFSQLSGMQHVHISEY